MSGKPKVAVLFPAFLGGGAESVCAWMLEALKTQYEPTLFTFSPIELESLNRMYATELSNGQVRVETARLPRWVPSHLGTSHRYLTLRQHLLIRYFKQRKETYDIVVSAFNEMDLGRPGLQYVHFPMVGRGHEAARRMVGYPDSAGRRLCRAACRLLSDFSDKRMRQNYTIANSHWTAALIERLYHVNPVVVHPPVVAGCPEIPWEERENGFVLIARVVPDKKLERAIRIVGQLRARGADAHLHVIGAGDHKYQSSLKNLAGDADWIFWEGELSRAEFNSLLARHRYGIHTRENEHFGIGIAEMLKSCCIPFVPANGGPMEIVGGEERLIFRDEDEAVGKIMEVIGSPRLQMELKVRLRERAYLFSTEKFVHTMLGVVNDFVAAHG